MYYTGMYDQGVVVASMRHSATMPRCLGPTSNNSTLNQHLDIVFVVDVFRMKYIHSHGEQYICGAGL